MTTKKHHRINRRSDYGSDEFYANNSFFFSQDINDWTGSRGKKSRQLNRENYERKQGEDNRRDFHLKHG